MLSLMLTLASFGQTPVIVTHTHVFTPPPPVVIVQGGSVIAAPTIVFGTTVTTTVRGAAAVGDCLILPHVHSRRTLRLLARNLY